MIRSAVFCAVCIVSVLAGGGAFISQPPFNIAFGVLAVAAFSFLGMLNFYRTNCPNCQHPQPFFRKPSNARQFWSGGNTCPKCGTQMDVEGRKTEPQKT